MHDSRLAFARRWVCGRPYNKMVYNSFMNPVMVHPSTLSCSVMPLMLRRAGACASMVGVQKGTTLYRVETTRAGAGIELQLDGIGTSPKQEAMMWLADGIGTSPSPEGVSLLADGIGTSPDHERS